MTERYTLSAEQDGYRYLSTKDHAHFARIVVALEGERPRADLEAQAELLASAPVLQAQLAEAVALLRESADWGVLIGGKRAEAIRAFLARLDKEGK